MVKLVAPFVFFMSLQAISAIAADDPVTLQRCVGALNAFESSINKGLAPVKSDWVRSKLGWVLLNSNISGKAMDDIRHSSGTMRDISYCESVGVPAREIDLFIFVFLGYLPADMFESFSECFAAFLIAAKEMDQILGVQRSQPVGFYIGKQFGEVSAQLNYMVKSPKLVLDEIQARAAKIQSVVDHLPAAGKESALKQLSEKCGWYNISLDSALETARIAGR